MEPQDPPKQEAFSPLKWIAAFVQPDRYAKDLAIGIRLALIIACVTFSILGVRAIFFKPKPVTPNQYQSAGGAQDNSNKPVEINFLGKWFTGNK